MTEITKLQRWLDLIVYLVGRYTPATFEDIAGHVPAYGAALARDSDHERAAARRMFERDKDELRSMGIPIRTVPYTIGFGATESLEGYVIDNRDFYLPYVRLVEQVARTPAAADRHRPGTLQLTPSEAPALLEALRRVAHLPSSPLGREARSAFRKLAFDLQPEAFEPESPVLFVEPPGTTELVERLRLLSDAMLARKRVRFRYHGIYRGEDTRRDVCPYGMLFQDGHWYLVGHDETRNDVRVFRAGRMDDVRPNRSSPRTPDFRVPADFRLDAFAGRKAWELGDAEEGPIIAEVLFRFPRSLWAARNEHGTLVRELEGGHTVRRFRVFQVNAFVRWLLGLGGEAELLGPAELTDQFRSAARDVARLHGGEDA
jgi:proteasome accessory factor B